MSLNGRSNEYIQAHNKLRDLLKKGKIYEVEYHVNGNKSLKKGKMRILSVVSTKTIVDATVVVLTYSLQLFFDSVAFFSC